MTYYPVGSTYPPDGPEPIWVDDMTCAADDADLRDGIALPAPMAHCGYAGWGLHNSNARRGCGGKLLERGGGERRRPLVRSADGGGSRGCRRHHDGSRPRSSFRLAFSEAVAVTPGERSASTARRLTVAG